MRESIRPKRCNGRPARVRELIVASLVVTVFLIGCGAPTATSLPFTKEQAIARASQDAKQSVPEVGIQQARVDSVTAGLITLAEADRRTGGTRGPGGYSPGQTPQSPVWWVVVRGYFQYEGMGAPPNPAPICEAVERDFIYDARTGEEVGGPIPNTRCAPARLLFATATRATTLVPTATIAPTSQSVPTITQVRTPFLITRLTATPTLTPIFPLPVQSPTATPTCPPPVPTSTAAPTPALNPPAAGSLDPAFGIGGKVLSFDGSGAVDMAIQPDGKIVTVGSVRQGYAGPSAFIARRFDVDGLPDCRFGNRGVVVANPYGDGYELSASGVAVQPDDKIVVVGTVGSDLALARFNADGSLDRTFGDGGKVTADLDRGSDWPRAVAIQSDGSIVVSGRSNAGEHAADALSLARFHADGSIDSAFGQGGRVITDMNRHGDGRALAIQPDGRIVVAGSGNSDLKMFNIAVLRYNQDGSFDRTFGNRGIVLTPLGKDYDGANALAIQPDGKLVVAGQSSIIRGRSTLALLRYNPDGSPDITFGSDGKATAILTESDTATAVAFQKDGKILVAGTTFPPGGAVSPLIARYNSDGTLDDAFGSGGNVITKVGINDSVSLLVILADGRILVAGTTNASSVLLLRYLP